MIPPPRNPVLVLTAAAALGLAAAPALDSSEPLDGAPVAATAEPAEAPATGGGHEAPAPPVGVEFPDGIWEQMSTWQREFASNAAELTGEYDRDFRKDAMVRLHRHELQYAHLWFRNIGPDDLDDPERAWRWRLALLYELATRSRRVKDEGVLRGRLARLEAGGETAAALIAAWEDRRVPERDKIEEFIRRAERLPEGRDWTERLRNLPPQEQAGIRRGNDEFWHELESYYEGR